MLMGLLSIKYECLSRMSSSENIYLTTHGIIGANNVDSFFNVAKRKGDKSMLGKRNLKPVHLDLEEKIQKNKVIVDLDVVGATEEVHEKKLMDICKGYCEEDARIVCKVFAEMYPDIMFDALRDEQNQMKSLINNVKKNLNTI